MKTQKELCRNTFYTQWLSCT